MSSVIQFRRYLFKKTLSIFLAALTLSTAVGAKESTTEIDHVVTIDNETSAEEITPADYTMINRIKKEFIPTEILLYTVVTGFDVAKILIIDNGLTKTLATGFMDTDVRTCEFTSMVTYICIQNKWLEKNRC